MMMFSFRLSLFDLVVLPAALTVQAAPCEGGACAMGQAPAIEWRQRDDAPGEAYLFVNGVQVGGYHKERDEWRDYASRAWSPSRPLFPFRARNSFRGLEETSTNGTVRNFGLALDKLQVPADDRYSLSGRSVSAAEALQAVAAGEAFRDDSDWLRVTVIGTPEQRRTVVDDLDRHELLSAWKNRLLVSAVGPDNPRVGEAGFKCDGGPTIYVQAPDGLVLHRQDEYRGPELLAEALQAAERRRKDPNYDPANDPDLNRRPPAGAFQVKTWHLYVAAGALLALLFRRKAS